MKLLAKNVTHASGKKKKNAADRGNKLYEADKRWQTEGENLWQ